MEPTPDPQTKDDARAERGEVKLDRCYGEIGISAVAAAVQCQGKRLEESTSILAPRGTRPRSRSVILAYPFN
jgi:hypothetical protein